MRRLWTLSLALMLAGCPADDDDSSVADDDTVADDDDSGTTDDDDSAVPDDDDSAVPDDDDAVDDDDSAEDQALFVVPDDVMRGIQSGIAAPIIGYMMWNGQVAAAQAASDPCPTIALAGGVMTVNGGCTDLQNRNWTGTIVATMVTGPPQVRTMEYTDFQIVAPNGTVVVGLHGTQVVQGTSLTDPATRLFAGFVSDMTLQLGQMTVFQNVLLTFTGLTHTGDVSALPPIDDQASDTVDHEGTVQVGGLVFDWDKGEYTIAVTDLVMDTEACDREGASGTIVLSGANVVTAIVEGATNCDGCFPYTSSDGLDDQICPE